MKKLTYKEFKETYLSVYINKDYFNNKTIEVFENNETITDDLILSELKMPRVYLKDLKVKGNIKNDFAKFAQPIVVLGTTYCNNLIISGDIYIDFNSIKIQNLFAIYAYEGDLTLASGSVPVFLDDTEYGDNLLNYLKVDFYISEYTVETNENVQHRMRFPDLANMFPKANYLKENNNEEYLEVLQYSDAPNLYPNTTGAWDIVENTRYFNSFVQELIAKSKKPQLINEDQASEFVEGLYYKGEISIDSFHFPFFVIIRNDVYIKDDLDRNWFEKTIKDIAKYDFAMLIIEGNLTVEGKIQYDRGIPILYVTGKIKSDNETYPIWEE